MPETHRLNMHVHAQKLKITSTLQRILKCPISEVKHMHVQTVSLLHSCSSPLVSAFVHAHARPERVVLKVYSCISVSNYTNYTNE